MNSSLVVVIIIMILGCCVQACTNDYISNPQKISKWDLAKIVMYYLFKHFWRGCSQCIHVTCGQRVCTNHLPVSWVSFDVVRPDTVMHPHLRAHFKMHAGYLLAKENAQGQLSTKVSVVKVETAAAPETHWLQTTIAKRATSNNRKPTMTLDCMWGEKLCPQYDCQTTP